MDDLFRFVLLRPANLPDESAVKTLEPSFLKDAPTRGVARRRAARLLADRTHAGRVDELMFGAVALSARSAAEGEDAPTAGDLAGLVAGAGPSLTKVVGDDRFGQEEQLLADLLVATKLVSDSAGTDAAGLANAAQGYDLLRRAAAAKSTDAVPLRPLQMPDLGTGEKPSSYPPRAFGGRSDAQGPDASSSGEGSTEGRKPAEGRGSQVITEAAADPQVTRIEAAIAALSRMRAQDFDGFGNVADPATAPAKGSARRTAAADPAVTPAKGTRAGAAAARAARIESESPAPLSTGVSGATWTLTAAAIEGLHPEVLKTIEKVGLDPAATPVPVVLRALEGARAQTMEVRSQKSSAGAHAFSGVVKIGDAFSSAFGAGEWVGSPAASMPTGHGTIRPVGIADLLLVKQHVVRYEGGELAHVENVLRSEHLGRDTRRLERTETTILTESETTKEQEQDTQSTDRFSLKRETSSTIKDDTQFKAGLSVDAKYGPFVEVKATADFATSHSSEESAKQASEFSKDVVSRSVSKVVERVLERRSTTTLAEFEEKYSHIFDNSAGATNISGVYQWVDKVLQAQVYNYGKRMLFDVTLPEPGTAYIVAQGMNKTEGAVLPKPIPFTLTADQITIANYAMHAQRYDVTGLEAPPPPTKTLSKALDGMFTEGDHESSKSADIAIDDGFQAKYALIQIAANFYKDNKPVLRFLVGYNWIDGFANPGYVDLSQEVGAISFAYYAKQVRLLAATIEIFCERTERAMKAWQLKTHAAITGGYLAKVQQYESSVAEAAAAQGVVVTGRNPMWNQRILTTELRKQCIELLTAQHFDAFGALEVSAQGYPQPNLARTAAQMPYVRFFEQAFEWEHIAYFFYPYFWGWKPGWTHRMLLDDVDPLFADFLRAGAGRVVFPVRPGFEAAVAHYLETGEIWNGGPAPQVHDKLYVPIIKEIQEATGAPGNEVPQGDPWLVRLPTTLTKLRADDSLPIWTKVGEVWQPAN